MKRAIALAAAAGLPLTTLGVVNTSVVWQVSLDNVNWSGNVYPDYVPGTQVYVRCQVSYIGTASPAGLASLVLQPTVSNWDATDTLLPFVAGGPTSASFPTGLPGGGANRTVPPGVVTDQSNPTQFGRVSPWGPAALGLTNFIRGFVHTDGSGGAPPGTWLRIAQQQVTSWIGGTGNTSGGSGVPLAQLSNVGRTQQDPPFISSLTNITVFKMGLTINSFLGGQLNIDSPTDGFGNRNTDSTSPDFGNREVYWWGDINTEADGSIRGTAVVTPATITFIPAPGGVAALALCGLVVHRRRRRTRVQESS